MHSSSLEGSLKLVVAVALNGADAPLVEHLAVQARVGHLDLDLVSRVDGADTRRRAGEQNIALLQAHDARNKLNEARHVEDHIGGRALLLGLSIDGELKTDVRVIRNLGGRDELSGNVS